MPFGYVPTRLGQVHYREVGIGEPLVLLHQPPRSWRVYVRLMACLEALGGVRVIALDLPGFGQSCDLPEGTSMTGLADVVHDAMSALGAAPASVFGLHTGNKVAGELARAHPGSVTRLVLAGMTHSIILDASRRNAAMADYVKRKQPTDPARDFAAWKDEQIDQLLSRGRKAIYAANYAFDLAAALEQVYAETLVIELTVPEEDALGRQAAAICARMPWARALQIDLDDWTLLQERPQQLAEALHAFVVNPKETS